MRTLTATAPAAVPIQLTYDYHPAGPNSVTRGVRLQPLDGELYGVAFGADGRHSALRVHAIGSDRYLAPAAANFVAALDAIPAADMKRPGDGSADGTTLIRGGFRHAWPASGDPASVDDAKRAAATLEDLIVGNAAGAALLDPSGHAALTQRVLKTFMQASWGH